MLGRSEQLSIRPSIPLSDHGGGGGGTELRNARKRTHDGASDILDAAAAAEAAAFRETDADTNWMRDREERDGSAHNISIVT